MAPAAAAPAAAAPDAAAPAAAGEHVRYDRDRAHLITMAATLSDALRQALEVPAPGHVCFFICLVVQAVCLFVFVSLSGQPFEAVIGLQRILGGVKMKHCILNKNLLEASSCFVFVYCACCLSHAGHRQAVSAEGPNAQRTRSRSLV